MRYTRRAVTAVMIFALVVNLAGNGEVSAPMQVRATSIRDRLDQAQQERNDLENKRDEIQEGIDDMKGKQNTLKGELNKLDTQLTRISDNLADLEEQISDKEKEISDTQTALNEARETEEKQYADMVQRVRKMYEHNDVNQLNAFIGAMFCEGSFSDMLNMADGYEKISEYQHLKLTEFQENRRLIEEHEASLQQENADLKNLKTTAEAEKNKVAGLISQTSKSITNYEGQITDAEQQAWEYEEEIRKKEEDIDYLRQELAKELALSKEAAEGEWRDISEITFAEGDRYLLANLIYCEAGAEPYEGKLAVGAVVINRVLSAKFPDSVVGVIYQNRQFSPVASGRLSLALANNRATLECYQAADEAMAGVTNVGNCVFFRTPIDGLTGINIGGHVFY